MNVPDDGPTGGSGAEQRLRISLEDWRMRELPDLDDAFVRSLGDSRDANALRSHIAGDLLEEAAEEGERVLRTRLLDGVLEANPFEVPESLVERHLASILVDAGIDDPGEVERSRDEFLPRAVQEVKRAIVLDRIAELRSQGATAGEIDDRIAGIAEAGSVDPEQVRSRLVTSGRLEALEREITQAKVFDFLKSRSAIVETD